MWLFCSTAMGLCFSAAGDPTVVPSGTSRLALTFAPLRWGSPVAAGGLLVGWIGNLVSAGPAERSRRWPVLRPLLGGAGLAARDLDAIALLRASTLARRLLSSVLIALRRGAVSLAAPLPPLLAGLACACELARFNSPNIASLCAKRSRMRR